MNEWTQKQRAYSIYSNGLSGTDVACVDACNYLRGNCCCDCLLVHAAQFLLLLTFSSISSYNCSLRLIVDLSDLLVVSDACTTERANKHNRGNRWPVKDPHKRNDHKRKRSSNRQSHATS